MKPDWQQHAETNFGLRMDNLVRISGGDFAEAFKAELDDSTRIFIKTHKNPPPNFFTTEANGLSWLAKSNTIHTPKVLAVNDNPPYLALEWINPGREASKTEEQFGFELAALHKTAFKSFGRPDNATTGSLALPNNPVSSWDEFYAEQRLLPLAKIAFDRDALPPTDLRKLEALAQKLPDITDCSIKPSLLHGDLWAGNRLVDEKGKSWLIDPAAHGGHREFDLAMMRLFGGYGTQCFHAYNDAFPLDSDWQARVQLHQIAPLVVHAIKFGGSYRSAAAGAIAQYS